MLAIIEDGNNCAYSLLKELNLPIDNIRKAIEQKLNNQPVWKGLSPDYKSVKFSPEAQNIMARVIADATSKKDKPRTILRFSMQ